MYLKTLLLPCAFVGTLTSSLPAAVTLLGHYGLGETGTVTAL